MLELKVRVKAFPNSIVWAMHENKPTEMKVCNISIEDDYKVTYLLVRKGDKWDEYNEDKFFLTKQELINSL